MKFKILREIDKEAAKRTEELKEHLKDVGHQIARDQEEWIDDLMRELLRPDIFQKAKNDDCQNEVDEYFRKHRIQITFIPDSMRIRIDVAGQQYAEFVPKFQFEDGEPIEMTPKLMGGPELN